MGAHQQREIGRRATQALLWSVVVTVALYAVPFGGVLAYPLMLLSTLFHELGHGITAAVVGGQFDSFVMYPDGSGVASFSGTDGVLDQALVAAGGLVGPALVAAVLFVGARRRRVARAFAIVVAATLACAAVVVVRNGFGLGFVGLCILSLGLVVWRGSAAAIQGTLVFLAVQLSLSVFSRSDYLFTDVARTGSGDMPSDVAQIAAALGGPYWAWGTACGTVSVALLGLGLWVFLRGLPALRPPPRGLDRLRRT